MRRSQPLGPASSLLGALLFAGAAFAAQAVAQAQQVTVFSDEFEDSAGLSSTNWPNVLGNYSGDPSASGYRPGTYDGSPDGFSSDFPSSSLYFRSDNSLSTERHAITATVDLSSYSSATLTFVFRAESRDGPEAMPFNGIDVGAEDILLEYTTDASSGTPTWVEKLGESDFRTSYAWDTITITLPTGALTSDVAFRWHQDRFEDQNDNWALDDILLTASSASPDPTSVPEPGTWTLFGTGALGLGAVVARRRRRLARVLAAAARTP